MAVHSSVSRSLWGWKHEPWFFSKSVGFKFIFILCNSNSFPNFFSKADKGGSTNHLWQVGSQRVSSNWKLWINPGPFWFQRSWYPLTFILIVSGRVFLAILHSIVPILLSKLSWIEGTTISSNM